MEALTQHLIAAGAGVVLVIIALIYRRQPVRSAGWNRPLLMPAFQVGIAIIILTIFLRGKITTLFDGITTDRNQRAADSGGVWGWPKRPFFAATSSPA